MYNSQKYSRIVTLCGKHQGDAGQKGPEGVRGKTGQKGVSALCLRFCVCTNVSVCICICMHVCVYVCVAG